MITCPNCNATCEPKDRARFLRRHPSKCQSHAAAKAAKREEMRKLAAGTRCVDDEEGRPVPPKSAAPKRTGVLV